MSLLSLTPLSILRVKDVFFSARRSSSIRCIVLVCFIVIISITISVLPLVPLLEDYFINALLYQDVTLLVGAVTKSKHVETLRAYYGRLQSKSLSWKTIQKMVGQMFSRDYGGVVSSKVGFYNTERVCLFKYFTGTNDPQKIFSLVIIICDFICFAIILVCYIIIVFASKVPSNTSKMVKTEIPDEKRQPLNEAGRAVERKVNVDLALERNVSLTILSVFCSWIPFIIIGILYFSNILDTSNYYEFCCIIILPITSLLTPVIYRSEFQAVRRHISQCVYKTMRRHRYTEQNLGEENEIALAVITKS